MSYFIKCALPALFATFAPVAALANQAPARPVEMTATLGQSVLAADQKQTVHVRIGLKGLATPASTNRPPMNIALVIDRSGSMGGARIVAARNAAMMAIDRLSPRDIISVVSYDDKVEVEVPATKANDPRSIKDKIARLTPRGSTAIWAGMQKGADEIRKFKSPTMVNKIILLSDGLANVGPSKPDDFRRLGLQMAQEGITVSTIGLGTEYNEELMAGLAKSSEGTHKFVAEPADLAQFFAREFDDAQNVVAQDIIIHIDLAPGLTPNRALGRQAEIKGSRMTFRLSQIIAETEQSLLLIVDVPASAIGAVDIGRVTAEFKALDGTSRIIDGQPITARVSSDAADIDTSVDKIVMRDVAILTAREDNEEAMRLRDAGRVEDSRKKFMENSIKLDGAASRFGFSADEAVKQQRSVSEQGAEAVPSAPAAAKADWDKKRKAIYESDTNQSGSRMRF
jgi:Ca-activated chloride channel homolog